MPLLTIYTYPAPVLHQQAKEVSVFDEGLRTFLDDMAQTMYHNQGIGLAANQVGVLKRVIVVDVSPDASARMDLVNPVILERSGSFSYEEGCLSVPEYRDTVSRSRRIVVQAQDVYGTFFQFGAEELLAVCIQHEIDHLDGKLFVDRLSRLKRELFRRWFKKNCQAAQEAQA